MKFVKMNAETVNKVLTYLQYRPYAEVCNLIQELQQSPIIEEEKEDSK